MIHRYLKDTVSLAFNPDKCTGCGRCEEVCPHRVFELSAGKARIADRNLCIECGACALNCPVKAITVNPGTGCASAIIYGWFTGSEPGCSCGDSGCC